ncbi:endonuclease/exonuclease/phosphatase family protein [Larkinella soli]|uniref:endonuclease/exonuclease/phosphatase family protein n=1 Tax=Larkinella soli TaxID=1770527 RepID=UPI000FFC7496|nr:endonuclease/exonuclease/phosphatase family protein [Larkinella soli]
MRTRTAHSRPPVSRRSSKRTLSPLRSVLALGTWGLLAASLIGFLGRTWFVFELASHFPVQYGLAAGAATLFWLRKSRLMLAVSVGVLVWSGIQVLPWLMASPPPAPEKRDFRVLHSNVFFVEHDTRRVVALIEKEQPDLFVLHEMIPKTIRKIDRATRAKYPYQFSTWAKNECYILVGSRTPIRIDRKAWLENRTIHYRTILNGRPLHFITVHPRTPTVGWWFRERNEQLAYVAGLARRQREPTLLIGDFNTSVWSPIYHDLIRVSGLNACRWGYGLAPTWNNLTGIPLLMIPIDHALINDGLQTVGFRTEDLPKSDHKSLVVDLAFRKDHN